MRERRSILRVENLPELEKAAFKLYHDSIDEVLDRKEDEVLWNTTNLDAIYALKDRLRETNTMLKQRGISNEDKEIYKENKELINIELEEFKQQEAAIKNRLNSARSKERSLKKAYDTEKGKRDYTSNLVQNQKENLLREIGIDRGSSHGGDLQGRGCTDFLQNADTFFDRSLEIDREAVRNGTALATLEEVELVNRRFKQLAILMERLLFFMNMDDDKVDAYGTGIESYIRDVSHHVEIFKWFWSYLRLSLVGAKFHGVKDHLIEMLQLWHSLQPFNEEFGEGDHVSGNFEKRQFGNLRDQQKKETAISKRTAIKSNSEVQAVIDRVSPSKKRKRLTTEDLERLNQRRIVVLEEVEFLKNSFPAGVAKITDYWKKID